MTRNNVACTAFAATVPTVVAASIAFMGVFWFS
jgi:hypothetical protein